VRVAGDHVAGEPDEIAADDRQRDEPADRGDDGQGHREAEQAADQQLGRPARIAADEGERFPDVHGALLSPRCRSLWPHMPSPSELSGLNAA
jgi:hypothetical protein